MLSRSFGRREGDCRKIHVFIQKKLCNWIKNSNIFLCEELRFFVFFSQMKKNLHVVQLRIASTSIFGKFRFDSTLCLCENIFKRPSASTHLLNRRLIKTKHNLKSHTAPHEFENFSFVFRIFIKQTHFLPIRDRFGQKAKKLKTNQNGLLACLLLLLLCGISPFLLHGTLRNNLEVHMECLPKHRLCNDA